MYRVKIFDEEHELDLEESINNFLESENISKVIDIKYCINCILYPNKNGNARSCFTIRTKYDFSWRYYVIQ